MAEIPIEKKERSNLLPLLLGALLLLALLGWCVTRDRDVEPVPGAADTTAVMTPGDTTLTGAGAAAGAAVGAGGNAVNDFVTYVATRDTSMETEANHQYTAGGVRRLAAAVEQAAGPNAASIQVYADSMRSSVDRLQQSAATDRHADDAKAAFSAAVSAMEQLDRAKGRTRDVAPMRAIYNQLNSQQPLMPQLGTVDRFFAAARDALQAMGAAA